MRPRLTAVIVAAGLLLAACGGDDANQAQPVGTEDGFSATGLLDGQRIAISRGAPTVVEGDCDPNEGVDEDLCILVRTIDGLAINVVVENPGVLVPGRTVEVDERDCGDDGCDLVRDVAVVVLRIDGEERPAVGGRMTVSTAGDRYAAEFDMRFDGATRLTGRFDVAPPRVAPILGPDAPTDDPDAPTPEP